MSREIDAKLAPFGWIATAILVGLGTAWAFQRGGQDFNVFHHAWQLVLTGRGMEIYRDSPDRYLYAPGFAWLLSPLGRLPRDLALALWCFAKAGALGFVIARFGNALARARPGTPRLVCVGVCALCTLLVARPLLIDFTYGQVNLFVLFACVWALLDHFESGIPYARLALAWFVLGLLAATKLFPLPLVAVPIFAPIGLRSRRTAIEMASVLTGIAVILVLPAVQLGFHDAAGLLVSWAAALADKGLPTDSHNQSFAGLLTHYFTATPTHVIALGPVSLSLGRSWITDEALRWLTLSWIAAWIAVILGWLITVARRVTLSWVAVMIGLLIVPSHLVWKPYFVMGLPAAILAFDKTLSSSSWVRWAALIGAFIAMNLTGFDFVGPYWGARFEAASLFLFAHLAILAAAGKNTAAHSSRA